MNISRVELFKTHIFESELNSMLAKDKYNANTTDQRLQSVIHCLSTSQSGSLNLPTAFAAIEPPPWSGRITCGG